MTRYTVVWDRDVETPFINAWIAGDSQTRTVLTDIANLLDSELSEAPDIKGTLHPELTARIVDIAPSSSPAAVSATFQVFPDDRLVRVIRLVFRSR